MRPDAAWDQARQRMEVIGPLAKIDVIRHEAADDQDELGFCSAR
jgi:hypothetical protein